MTATNHALTGAAIGLIVGQPVLALPLALVSHFICDAIPHYRTNIKGDKFMKASWFTNYLLAEVLFCLLIVSALALSRPLNWQLAVVCAFIAASPDLLSINRFRSAKKDKKWKPNLYARFASGIQWFERPIGAAVEIAWLIAMIVIIIPFLA